MGKTQVNKSSLTSYPSSQLLDSVVSLPSLSSKTRFPRGFFQDCDFSPLPVTHLSCHVLKQVHIVFREIILESPSTVCDPIRGRLGHLLLEDICTCKFLTGLRCPSLVRDSFLTCFYPSLLQRGHLLLGISVRVNYKQIFIYSSILNRDTPEPDVYVVPHKTPSVYPVECIDSKTQTEPRCSLANTVGVETLGRPH